MSTSLHEQSDLIGKEPSSDGAASNLETILQKVLTYHQVCNGVILLTIVLRQRLIYNVKLQGHPVVKLVQKSNSIIVKEGAVERAALLGI